MKLWGVVLIFLSAAYGYLLYRHTTMRTLRLLRAIADDLPLLQCRICVQRCSLPAIFSDDLCRGLSGRYLWTPLANRLARAEGTFQACWDSTMDELPPIIAERLSPLGKLLPVGGDTLASAIEEVNRGLLLLAQEEQTQQKVRLQLSAAMYFSAATLFVLVFV